MGTMGASLEKKRYESVVCYTSSISSGTTFKTSLDDYSRGWFDYLSYGFRLCIRLRVGNKQALERIRRIRQLDKHHNMTLVCRDLSTVGTYARVTNPIFRLLKAFTPDRILLF